MIPSVLWRALAIGGMTLLAADGVASPGSAIVRSEQPRYVIYLHGRIVQEKLSARPQSPEYGFYELEQILDAFRGSGFVVTGEIRPKSASVSDSADRVVGQIRRLLSSGVPPDRITVVGASMGASIAFLASTRLENPDVRFVVLGACLSANVKALLAEEGKGPSGRLLAIREASDELSDPCPPWTGDEGTQSRLRAREIVIRTGLRHGFIYRPLPEWVDPAVEWASGEAKIPSSS
jgi:pimeloyl-ACP methyl ester carboxylesterase